ncbi:MAG: hypothetical protein JRJ03_00445 [Deltaproteobacteria bacterium]|nr:hypothetical protein [Deltaproteobacteria bacterium]
MTADWKRIKNNRTDITDWLIHWTHGRLDEKGYVQPFEVLKEILSCGFLKPTFAPKSSRTIGETHNTIKGDYPAVCFTDQPLSAFIQSCRALGGRYQPYGIAIKKSSLFIYGGRPVIYGDKNLLERLHEDDKHLWARYDPIPDPLYRNYPVDWTHEREWRVLAKDRYYRGWGMTPAEGVPLVLLDYVEGKFVKSLPYVLVDTVEEANGLHEWLQGHPKYEGTNHFIRELYSAFAELQIIPLDIVSKQLNANHSQWARLETLPLEDLDSLLKLQLQKK